jgi:hypothetical protein
MTLLETLFGNLFNRRDIMLFRLLAFARFLLGALTANNPKKDWDDYILKLTDLLTPIEKDLDSADLELAIQLSKTGTVDDVVDDFEHYMSNIYVDVAYKSKTSPETLEEIYPRGRSEYHSPSRTDAPVLMQRVADLGKKHEAVIGKDIADGMGSFKPKYDAARNVQQQQMSMVKTSRGHEHSGRPALELMLTEIIHEIARRHPGDVDACKAYVRWNLLYDNAPHHDKPNA